MNKRIFTETHRLAISRAKTGKKVPAMSASKKGRHMKPEWTLEQLLDLLIPIPESGCMVWPGAVTAQGYGETVRGGRKKTIHRLSWMLAHGPIPKGLCVCHHCDVPLCGRPDHLFLGTHKDNFGDMRRKDRNHTIKGQIGWSSGLTKETDPRVAKISQARLAQEALKRRAQCLNQKV